MEFSIESIATLLWCYLTEHYSEIEGLQKIA